MFKLCFYVPESHLETVKAAVFAAGAGRIGDYECCCWQVPGQGQFRPLPGSEPFLGQLGELERVLEYRVEMVCARDVAAPVVAALLLAHPYEQPAWDLLATITEVWPVTEIFDRIAARLPLDRSAWSGAHGEGNWPEAGVLVGLTDEPLPRVLLGRRAMHLPLHPGEVAFPGGKREREDNTPWDTALRETMEEVGLPANAIHPLGELESLITRTGFEVYPCIAKIPAKPQLVVDPGEFDSVFLPRLDVFADHGVYRLERMSDGEHTRMVPHYQLEGDNVWGVTAAMLALVVNVAYDAGLDLQRDWKQTP